MSAYEGSKMQERDEDRKRQQDLNKSAKDKLPVKKSPTLINDGSMMDQALNEAGKIMITAFDLLNASGMVKAELVSGGKKYQILFQELKQNQTV